MFPYFAKDGVPHLQSSYVIHQIKCLCEADYVGRTNLPLEARIGQDEPASIREGRTSNSNPLTQAVCQFISMMLGGIIYIVVRQTLLHKLDTSKVYLY